MDQPGRRGDGASNGGNGSTEEELRRSRAFLDSVVENIPNMVFVKDAAELRFVRLNRAGEELLGYSLEEMVGKNDFDFFPESEARFFIEKDREVLEGGQLVDIPAEPIQTRFRGQRILHTQKIPILDEEGRPEYLLGISEDITDRLQVLETLRERQQTLDAVFEASPDAIMILGPDLSIREVSAALEHLDGIPDGDRSERVPITAVHPEDRDAVEAAFASLLSNPSSTIETRYRLRHSDGHWVPVEARGRALLDADGQPSGAVVVLRDISERVATEQALMAARHDAETANRAKNDFLSRMSHELRTPLNAVLGFAQLLEMELEDEAQLESVRHILRGGRHLLELINDVLDISRIESGTLAISLEPVVLGDVVQECLDLVAPQATHRRIELVNEGVPDEHVHADRHRLSQVLLNLLSNAIKFNHDGGRVTIRGQTRDGHLRLDITDTGAGIAPEMVSRLFTPFDRLGAEARGIEGTGLGLVVSQRLCDAMGIEMGVDTEQGVGSTFWLDLPLGDRATAVDVPVGDGARSVGRGTGTLLHIEDNVANLRLVDQLLRRHRPGLHLMDAVQGSIGLELAVEHQPDLILLDVHLPDLPGDVVLGRLKSDPRTADIPVVVVSADATAGQVERFRQAGAHDYLTKPLDIGRLLEVVDRLAVRASPSND